MIHDKLNRFDGLGEGNYEIFSATPCVWPIS